MAHGDAARIRARLNYPILDGDGHWLESLPVLVDYVRDVAGGAMADTYLKSQSGRGRWYDASWEQRRNQRLQRGNWWITTGDTTDFATAMLPGLLAHRMDELAIDFGVIYPTRCLGANNIPQADLRQAVCRAYNVMVADLFGPYTDRHPI